MPFISSFGTNSARNYGQRARQPQLVQLTYTSNSTFVVPSGVSSVSISARGGSGSYQPYVAAVAGASYQTSFASYAWDSRTATSATWVVYPSFINDEPYRSTPFNADPWTGGAAHEVYETAQGFGFSRMLTWAGSSSGPFGAVWDTNNTRSASYYEPDQIAFRDSCNSGTYPRTVYAPRPMPFTYIRISSPEIQEAYYTGSNATGFGYTFPGGYGGTADTYNYTKSVSFGESYSLVVPGSSSFITVSYYV